MKVIIYTTFSLIVFGLLAYLGFTDLYLFFLSLVISLLSLTLGFIAKIIKKKYIKFNFADYFFWVFTISFPVFLILITLTLVLSKYFPENYSYFNSLFQKLLLGGISVVFVITIIRLFFGLATPIWQKNLSILSIIFTFVFGLSFYIYNVTPSRFEVRIQRIPPNIISALYKANFKVSEYGEYTATENYTISIDKDYSSLKFDLFQPGDGEVYELKEFVEFEDNEIKNKPQRKVKLINQRKGTFSKNEIGLVRSKIIISPKNLDFYESDPVDEKSPNISLQPSNQILKSMTLDQSDSVSCEIEIEMPKNSVLNTYPKSDIISLPDKDIVNLKTSDFGKGVEIYYIKQPNFRNSSVKSFLSADSSLDLFIKIIQFLFLPILLFFVAAFREKLQNFIVSIFKKQKKPNKIGF